MRHVQIQLLGRFRLIDERGRDVPLAPRKAPQLLALLALGAPRPVRRDRVIGLLWSEIPEERARHNLRQPYPFGI
jgi:DNA-binding SARP family transcriptional activator